MEGMLDLLFLAQCFIRIVGGNSFEILPYHCGGVQLGIHEFKDSEVVRDMIYYDFVDRMGASTCKQNMHIGEVIFVRRKCHAETLTNTG